MSTHQNIKSLQIGSVEISTVQSKRARISKRKVPILASVVFGLVLTLLAPARVAASSSLNGLGSLAASPPNPSMASADLPPDNRTMEQIHAELTSVNGLAITVAKKCKDCKSH